MKKNLLLLLAVVANATAFAQTGINTTTPTTTLDVAGSTTFRDSVITLNTTSLTLSRLNRSQFTIIGSPGGTFTITPPTTTNGTTPLVNGARMTIVNRTSYEGYVGVSIVHAGAALDFVFTSGTWNPTVGDNVGGWGLIGSNVTASSYIGTNNAVPLYFRVYGNPAGIIDPFGNNTALGAYALSSNTSTYNTAFGTYSLNANTGGYANTSIGFNSMGVNQSGYHNTALGYYALYTNNGGIRNTAIGDGALNMSSSGNYNTAVGQNALASSTVANNNTAVGYLAALSNTGGYSGVAIGSHASYSNQNGDHIVAIGDSALFSNTTDDNLAVGTQALGLNTNGAYNVAVGNYTLGGNVNAYFNTAVGYDAFPQSTSGGNAGLGAYAGYSVTSGLNNTFIGYYSGANTTIGSNNTSLGYNSGASVTNIANTTCIGYSATTAAANSVHLGNTSVSNISGQVSFSTYSDRRIKENITPNVPGLAFISLLHPVTYNLNIHRQNQLMGIRDTVEYEGKYDIEKIRFSGFIAQDVEAAARQLNYDFSGVIPPANNKDLYSVRYSDFVVPLVKAVQEQQQQIDDLKNENADLLRRLQAIEAKLSTSDH